MPTSPKKDQGVPPSGTSSSTHDDRPSAPPPGGDAGSESFKGGRFQYIEEAPESDQTTKDAFFLKRTDFLLTEKMRTDSLAKMEKRSADDLLKEIDSMLRTMEKIIEDKSTRKQSIKETVDLIEKKPMDRANVERRYLVSDAKFENQCKQFAECYAKYESTMRELTSMPEADTRELLAQVYTAHRTADITKCAGEISTIFPRLMEEAKEQQQGYQPPKLR